MQRVVDRPPQKPGELCSDQLSSNQEPDFVRNGSERHMLWPDDQPRKAYALIGVMSELGMHAPVHDLPSVLCRLNLHLLRSSAAVLRLPGTLGAGKWT